MVIWVIIGKYSVKVSSIDNKKKYEIFMSQ